MLQISVSMQFSVTFTFLFPNIRDCILRKKRELATQFFFLCMSTTVSGSNSWSFAIIRDQSLEVWQRALRMIMTGDNDTAPEWVTQALSSLQCQLAETRPAASEAVAATEMLSTDVRQLKRSSATSSAPPPKLPKPSWITR